MGYTRRPVPYRRPNYSSRRVPLMKACSGKAFNARIRKVIARPVAIQKKAISSDPPIFMADRPWRRTVRVVPVTTANGVSNNVILAQEATYYGLSAARWRGVKVLAFKAYGPLTADTMTIQVPVSSNETGVASFSDYADNNHRPVISVDMPANQTASNLTTDMAIVFAAGSVELVDFYVEFY